MVVSHAFIPSTRVLAVDGSLSSKSTWSTEQVQDSQSYIVGSYLVEKKNQRENDRDTHTERKKE